MHSSDSDSVRDFMYFFAHWRTLTLVFSLVVIAGLIWDPVFISILPNTAVIPSMARASVPTVDHMLHRQIGRWPRPFPLNVDAIWWERQRKQSFHLNEKDKTHQTVPVNLVTNVEKMKWNCCLAIFKWVCTDMWQPVLHCYQITMTKLFLKSLETSIYRVIPAIALVLPCAQQEPQYWGMCWLRVVLT